MRIAVLVEGQTELAFKKPLQLFLSTKLQDRMPALRFHPYNGRIPKEEKLGRIVRNLLTQGNQTFDAVIALSDVYTGTSDFSDADDAKQKMKLWVGNEPRFHAHVALHDFEAWLLPYWGEIQRLAKSNRASPGNRPELINHGRPPSKVLAEVFINGKGRDAYSKTRDAARILKGQSLEISAAACPELKAFLNTIIRLSGGIEI